MMHWITVTFALGAVLWWIAADDEAAMRTCTVDTGQVNA
jgi:hypothetical protein